MSDEQATIAADQDSGATKQVAAHERPSSSDALTGTLLSGRYLVEECLGEGAMGAVYRAEHTLMRKTVAIKVLRSQIEGRSDLVERFQREAQAAANIDHPNVCSASDFGQMPDGTFFLVIEYLEGRTLEEELEQNGPMDAVRALDIVAKIADGLARAHDLDIVHRDLKPENIMLVERDGDRDHVKILDFGVARVRLTDEHEQAQLTKAGTVWGTPTYMSPEQAAGGEVDGRSDLYSLGVMLYEMLAGRPPFEADNPARVMAMHMTEQPPPLENEAVPADVARLLGRLLDKVPQRRPASARALHEEIVYGRSPVTPNQNDGSRPAPEAADRADTPAVVALQRLAEQAKPAVEQALQWFRDQSTVAQGISIGILAALLLGFVATPIVLVASSLSGPETDEERQQLERDLSAERAAFLQTAGLSEVPDLLEQNQTTAALEALDAVDKAHANNPHVAYLRGRVNGARGRWQASVENYALAVEAEPLYAHDKTLIEHVFERFSDRSAHRAKEAKALIEEHLDSPFVSRKLAQMATYEGRAKVRKRAFALLENTGRLSDVEDWRRLGIELGHAKGCEERKEKIAAIVDQGDPQALEVLEHFANKGKTGCGLLNLEDCYGCIRGDLQKAIEALEAR